LLRSGFCCEAGFVAKMEARKRFDCFLPSAFGQESSAARQERLTL